MKSLALTVALALLIVANFALVPSARAQEPSLVSWVEVGGHLLLTRSESQAGWLLDVLSEEQIKVVGKSFYPNQYVVQKVTDRAVVLRSVEPRATAFGVKTIEKTIPLVAIAEVQRFVDP